MAGTLSLNGKDRIVDERAAFGWQLASMLPAQTDGIVTLGNRNKQSSRRAQHPNIRRYFIHPNIAEEVVAHSAFRVSGFRETDGP